MSDCVLQFRQNCDFEFRIANFEFLGLENSITQETQWTESAGIRLGGTFV